MKTQTHVEPEPKHIWPFLAWTFGISWSAWLASAFLRIPIISQVLTIAGVFGPAIGAKLVLGKSFKELYRIGPKKDLGPSLDFDNSLYPFHSLLEPAPAWF